MDGIHDYRPEAGEGKLAEWGGLKRSGDEPFNWFLVASLRRMLITGIILRLFKRMIMEILFSLLASGVSLGLSAGMLPGPLQTVLIQNALAHGWRYSIIGIFSPLVADIPVILLVMVVLSQFPPELARLLQIGGGLFLLYMAWGGWKSWRAGESIGGGLANDPIERQSRRKYFARVVAINLLSPGPYIFWGTVNGPLLRQGLDDSLIAGAGFMLAFYGVFLGILAGWVFIFDRLRRVNPKVTRSLVLVTVIALVFLGVRLIAQGVGLIS